MMKYILKLDDGKEYQGSLTSICHLLGCLIQLEADYNPSFITVAEIEDMKYEIFEASTIAELIDTFNNFGKVDTKISEMYSEKIEGPTVEGWDTAIKAVQNYKKFGQFSI